ncbi:MAG: 50S ribosomal protein L22 [Chloroflexi bacterium]|nr:50S ribosomal protein L22 [Chloroflexota bacterium]
MPVKATVENTGISFKKMKSTLDLVRGKKLEEALRILRFMPSPTARRLERLMRSAAANAENELLVQRSDLKVVEVYAGEAVRTKRFRARARGRAGKIIRRNTHLTVLLDEQEQ